MSAMLCGVMLWGVVPAVSAESYLVTVLRTSDAQEMAGLNAPRRSSGDASRAIQRRYGTSLRQRHVARWQVVVSDNQPGFVAIDSVAYGIQDPWITRGRHGAVPHVRLEQDARSQGILVQAHRHGNEVEVRLSQSSGNAGSAGASAFIGASLSTVLRGSPGQWLDAGGTLMADDVPAGMRRYQVRHNDPRHFRLLVRVDVLD